MPWIENKDFMDVDVLGSNKTWQKHGKNMANHMILLEARGFHLKKIHQVA